MNTTLPPAAVPAGGEDWTLRLALRALATPESPRRDLWPAIAACLPPRLVARRFALPACAAAVLLLCGVLPLLVPARVNVADADQLRRAVYQLDAADAHLQAAQRLQPRAAYLTELLAHSRYERARLLARLGNG